MLFATVNINYVSQSGRKLLLPQQLFSNKWLKENNPEHYLTEWLIKGKRYCTTNNHRSAISAFHKSIVGVRVGQHELTCKLVGDCLNANPPQYNPDMHVVTWGVEKVYAYISDIIRDASKRKHIRRHIWAALFISKAGRLSGYRFARLALKLYAVKSYEGL